MYTTLFVLAERCSDEAHTHTRPPPPPPKTRPLAAPTSQPRCLRRRLDLDRRVQLGGNVAASRIRGGCKDGGGYERQRLELPESRCLHIEAPTGSSACLHGGGMIMCRRMVLPRGSQSATTLLTETQALDGPNTLKNQVVFSSSTIRQGSVSRVFLSKVLLIGAGAPKPRNRTVPLEHLVVFCEAQAVR